MWIRIRPYIKATWPLSCHIFLSPRLFVHRFNQVSNKDTVQVRDHSVFAPSQWEATLQCYTIISHWLGAYRMFPASPALVVLCVGKTLVDSLHHIMSLSGGRTSTAGLCLFLFFTWLSPWTSSQVARKLVALMLMWLVGYDSYKNMYDNRNVHLYFTDFITHHMAVIFTPFSVRTLMKIRCIHWAFNTQCLNLWGVPQGM